MKGVTNVKAPMDSAVRFIQDPQQKAAITEEVLRALPEWFGSEAAILEYVHAVPTMAYWAGEVSGRPVGFLALMRHNAYTFEIYCMGIRPEVHRAGLGSALVAACEAHSVNSGAEFLTVKTLDASRPHEGYAKTRAFYLDRGFRPLEVFPTLWDKDNPCLFMAKALRPPV